MSVRQARNAHHYALQAAMAMLFAFSLSLAACDRSQVSERPPEAGDVAVAKVGELTVWASDVKREAVAQGRISEGEPLDVSSEVFTQVLEEVIDQKILAQEAIRRKLDQDPGVQRKLSHAREKILHTVLVEQEVEGVVTEQAINEAYQELLKLSRSSEEFKARRIVTPSLEEADAVKRELAQGMSFESLAMSRSTDQATRFNGGDLGYFTPDVFPELEPALRPAKVGDVIGPLQTEDGFVLLKIEDRRPEQAPSLDATKPQIVRFLTYGKVRDLLENLRRKTKVEMLVKSGPGLPGTPEEPESAPPAGPPAPGALPVPAQPPASTPAAPAAKAPTS